MGTSRTASCACGRLRVNVVGEPVRVESATARNANGGLELHLRLALFSRMARFQQSRVRTKHSRVRPTPAARSNIISVRNVVRPYSGIGKLHQSLSLFRLAVFTDSTFPAPKAAIWAAHKLHWVEFPSGMPVLDAQPG